MLWMTDRNYVYDSMKHAIDLSIGLIPDDFAAKYSRDILGFTAEDAIEVCKSVGINRLSFLATIVQKI